MCYALGNRTNRTKTKLSISQSIFVPTLIYGHEVWVMTERIRLQIQIQVAEMGFRRVAGVSLREMLSSSVIHEFGVQLLLLCRDTLVRISVRKCSRHLTLDQQLKLDGSLESPFHQGHTLLVSIYYF